MKKIFYIVLDGMGDKPVEELGNKTPLEAANTPVMDALAEKGSQGLMYTVGKNTAPESDIAVISLLGYDAHKLYTGRGPLETFAEGIDVNDGDLALRVNFATAEKDSDNIADRRVGRNLSTEEATELAKEINEKVKLDGAEFIFKNTVGHRGILIIKKNGSLTGQITNTDPAYGKEGVFGIALETFEPVLKKAVPVQGKEQDQKAQASAEILNEFTQKSREVLENSEINEKRESEGKLIANLILSRDAGDRLPKFKPIKETTGYNFGSFVQMPVEKGIALLCGMDIVDVPLPSGDSEKDLTLWADTAAEKIKDFDGLYIHIKGPDEPAHDGDYKAKKQIIEEIDKFFFERLLSKVKKEDYVIAVTADHSTVCKVKAHTADPVPLLVYSSDIADDTKDFSESASSKGKLGEIMGKDLIYKLTDLAK